MKVKLFTTDTVDGHGVIILTELFYDNKLDYQICSNDNVNKKVIQFIKSDEYLNYDMIYIVDLSINEETAKLINSDEELRYNIILLDYHKTSEWLNKYSWANIVLENNKGIIECSTSLLYKYLLENFKHLGFSKTQSKIDFVETVRSYNTMEWNFIKNSLLKC